MKTNMRKTLAKLALLNLTLNFNLFYVISITKNKITLQGLANSETCKILEKNNFYLDYDIKNEWLELNSENLTITLTNL